MAQPVYGRRGFQEIRISPLTDNAAAWTSYGWSAPYELQYGRENLAALSHEYNYYFIAVGNVIHVTQPDVLYRKVACPDHRGRFKIPAVGTSPGPFQSRRNRFGVNHLLIEKLGLLEAILCACDDGTVAAYWVKDIAKQMKSCSTVDKQGWLNIEPTPIFLMDVGQSAWGLAVHTQSRKIAISSNDRTIRVVNFGASEPMQYAGFECHVRGTLQLQEHKYNIPTISFCNGPEDPEGRWLASSDLSSEVIVWYLSEPVLHSTSKIACRHNGLSFDYERAFTWALTCLSPSHFRSACTPLQMWGTDDGQRGDTDWSNVSSFDASLVPFETLSVAEFRSCQSATSEYIGTGSNCPRDPEEVRIHTNLDARLAQQHSKPWYLEMYTNTPRLNPPFATFQCRGPDVFLNRPVDNHIAAFCEDATFSQLARISFPDLTRFIPTSDVTHMPYLMQIPELSLVICGNSIGRVAIFSATVRDRSSGAFMDEECQQEYGLRLEWLLPLPFENYGVKRNIGRCIAHGPLVGLAASPIPGLELFENGSHSPSSLKSPRRWRLFMQFVDGQTLCYELERAETPRES